MTHKGLLPVLALVTLLASILLLSCSTDSGSSKDAALRAQDKSEEEAYYLGTETCMECHAEHLYDLPQSKHWQPADARSPGAHENGCELCHGPGGPHLEKDGGLDVPGLIVFGKNANVSAAKRNRVCLQCHQRDVQHWQGSAHDNDDIACAGCHSMHRVDKAMRRLQEQTFCYSCHQNIRAETYRPFRHPIREELLFCSDCHNPHGSTTPGMLHQYSLNENCYSCHAEKRGPLLWEHEPVSEDCANCHLPHGSLQPALLVSRPPLLCQQCHQDVTISHARRAFTFGTQPLERGGGESAIRQGPGQGQGPIGGQGPGGGEGPIGGQGPGGGEGSTGGQGPGGGDGQGQGNGGSGQGQGPGNGSGTGGGDGQGSGGSAITIAAHDDDHHGDDHEGGQGPGGGEGPIGGQGPGGGQGPVGGQGPGGGIGPLGRQGAGGNKGNTGEIPGGTSRFLMGGSCLNCHTQIHGSNHPSGIKLTR